MSKGVQIALAALSVFAGVVIVLTLGASGEGAFRYYADLGQFAAAPSSDATTTARSTSTRSAGAASRQALPR